jgi:hypothetical protein
MAGRLSSRLAALEKAVAARTSVVRVREDYWAELERRR